MLYQWSSASYNLRAFSGPERGLGVNTPGAAFDRCGVGAHVSIPQLPFLSEEVSDICSAQSFKGSPEELAPVT